MGEEETRQLTARQMGRYERQMVLPEVGVDGQRRLLASRVLIIGAGALGSAAATYLATAGVGTIGLVDGDRVELSNLHRQILHDESQVGALKTDSGVKRLKALNPDIHVVPHSEYLSSENVLRLLDGYDVIVNGSDNFPARYLVNDAAVIQGKPLVDAAILRFEGHLSVFMPQQGCYRCLFPAPPPPGTVPDCAEAGVFGALAGVLGSMQAVEALKILLNIGDKQGSKFLIYNALTSNWQRVPFGRDEECMVCGDSPTVTAPIDYERFCGITSTNDKAASALLEEPGTDRDERGSDQDVPRIHHFAVDVSEADRLIASNLQLTVVDVRSEIEFRDGHLEGAVHCPIEELDALGGPHSLDHPFLVVCAAGVRSDFAAKYLREKGCTAWTLTGGVRAWMASGRTLVRE